MLRIAKRVALSYLTKKTRIIIQWSLFNMVITEVVIEYVHFNKIIPKKTYNVNQYVENKKRGSCKFCVNRQD